MDTGESRYNSFPIPMKLSQTRIQIPKVFSLQRSVNQRDNTVIKTERREGLPLSQKSKAFGPGQLLGGEQGVKRNTVFPALQPFHNLQETQTPAPQLSPAPFFSLLKRSTSPVLAPAKNSQQKIHPAPHYQRKPSRESPRFVAMSRHDSEPLADKDWPLSPSPQPDIAHTVELQMRPPHSSVVSIPRPESRSKSRSHSSASFRTDGCTSNLDHSADLPTPLKSKGLPDLAINLLQELQVVNDELAEERRHAQSVLSELSALSSAHEALKSNYSIQREEIVSTRQELDAAKHGLSDLQKSLAEANSSKEAKQQEFKEVLVQLGNVQMELKEGMEARKLKIASVTERLAELNTNFAQLQTSYHSLQLSYDASQASLSEMRHARGLAADGLQTLEPLLDANRNYIRAGEVKSLTRQFQDDLASSQRVNDILRDKLHRQSSQLDEMRAYVQELEDAEQGRLGEIATILSGTGLAGLGEPGDNIRYVIERLVKCEQETVEVLVEAAATEEQSNALKESLEEVQMTLAQREKQIEELIHVRDNNRALEARILEFEAVQQVLQHTTDELQDLTTALQERDNEICTIQNEVVELRARKAELQARLSKTKTISVQTEENAQKAEKDLLEEARKAGEAQGRREFLEKELEEARTACGEAEKVGLKNKLLEAEIGQIRNDIAERQHSLREAENQVLVLQDRFDAQGITLRLAKEHSGDLQDRLLDSESSFATKLASLAGKHQTELAVLQVRNVNLEQTVDKLKQDYAMKEVAHVDAYADLKKKLEKQEAASERIDRSEMKRADAAERETMDARRQLKGERCIIEELGKRIIFLETQQQQVEEEGRRKLADVETVGNEKVAVMKGMVAELERINGELVEKGYMLKERYETHNLTDEEKDFVDWLLTLSRSICEQEDVAKTNELRRRENMINTLQTRIRELESTLARYLHEKSKEDGGPPKSMVDLTTWMSSPTGSDHTSTMAATLDASTMIPLASHAHTLPAAASSASSSADPSLLAALSLASPVISPDATAPRGGTKPIPKSKKSKTSNLDVPAVQAATSGANQTSRATKKSSRPAISDLDSDSDNDIPLSLLMRCRPEGLKGPRAVSPMKQERPRATRRLKAAARVDELSSQGAPPVQTSMSVKRKALEGQAKKPKPKKRKA